MGLYKEYIEKDYFDKNWNAYEILAGIFGTKLQLNRIFFLNKINHVQKLIDNYIENIEIYKKQRTDKYVKYINEKKIDVDTHSIDLQVGKDIVETFCKFNNNTYYRTKIL